MLITQSQATRNCQLIEFLSSKHTHSIIRLHSLVVCQTDRQTDRPQRHSLGDNSRSSLLSHPIITRVNQMFVATYQTKHRPNALTRRNTTGPPWSVGHPTDGPPAVLETTMTDDNNRRQQSKVPNNTGPLGGPVMKLKNNS